MPASWIGAISGGIGLINNLTGGGGGGGGSNGPTYTPTGLGAADTGWQNAFGQIGGLADTTQQNAQSQYLRSLQMQQQINPAGYLQGAQTAGDQYGLMGGLATQQMGQYGNAAQLAGQQQAGLYGGANQIMQHAFDPNMAQYNQTAAMLGGQVNAGQAARGLGNSPVGAQEYGNTMANFNNDWHTAQLAREAQGLGAAAQGSNAGGAQGQLMGANLAAQLGTGEARAGYAQQQGAIPYQAQQFAAQQPGAAAATYANQMGGLSNLYGQQAGLAIPYMNAGQGAQQYNTAYNTQQNADNTQALMSGVKGITQPGSWLSNMFSQPSQGQANPYGYDSGGYPVDSGGGLSFDP